MNHVRTPLGAAICLLAAALLAAPATAQTVSPGDGNAFGQHVAEMAPEHPRDHGAEFGECVSSMARTGTCPHHP
jgi:hypothetical protein